ncbi:MAG: hypothetical protein KKF65_04695 [Nanoarchaeota archaeon]|nr:hypothetical protein [Nanoarchaeota archaeon]
MNTKKAQKSNNEEFNITFYGCGGVAEKGLAAICATTEHEIFRPINKIYLVGNEGSYDKREGMKKRAQEITSENRAMYCTEIINSNKDDLETILKETSLFFFTASKHLSTEKERPNMIESNLPLIDELAKYFNQEFKGIINIVSNLPEALAHYAAQRWNIPSIRQITAHVPIEEARCKQILKTFINKKFNAYEGINIEISGYHDRPWPILRSAEIIIGTTVWDEDVTFGIYDLIREHEGEIVSELNKWAVKQIEWEIDYLQRKYSDTPIEKLLREVPTAIPTGRAIQQLTKAVINRGTTTIGIPYKIGDNHYFFKLPTTFERGFPELNEDKLELFSNQDFQQIQDRIVGPTESLEAVINTNLPKEFHKLTANDDTELMLNMFKASTRVITTRSNANAIIINREETPINKERLLTNSLNSRIYTHSKISDRTIVEYSFNKSKTPIITTYILNLPIEKSRPTNWSEMAYEHKRTRLGAFAIGDNEVFGLSERNHGGKTFEYKLFVFEKHNNKPIHISEPITRNEAGPFIQDMSYNENLYFLRTDNNRTSICVYQPEEGLIRITNTNLEVQRIIPYHKGLILATPREMYVFDGQRIISTPIITSQTDIGRIKILNEQNNLMFYNELQGNMIVKDLENNQAREITTMFKTIAVTNLDEGGIQVITQEPEGIIINNYYKKQDLFKGTSQIYVLQNELFENKTSIWTQDENLFFFSDKPGNMLAIYHEGNNYCMETLDINNFDKTRTQVEKND